jgi:hypothetical protein
MACDEAEDAAWRAERIAKTKALITAHEDAILALSTGAQSYTLNTGQTQQTVLKANVASLRDTLKWLESRLADLQADDCGGGATHVVPGF